MRINVEDLKKYKTYVTYNHGYRIVYFYEKYHEVPFGLYAEKITDFNKMLNVSLDLPIKDLLDIYLKQNKEALGVAIYDINAKCIEKKVKGNTTKTNNSEVYKEELIYDYTYVTADNGYRIVYFYPDGGHYIGSWSEKIEGFMFHFCESYPIYDDNEIPPFISIDDLLTKYLNDLPEISAVALYKVDGVCIKIKERQKMDKK